MKQKYQGTHWYDSFSRKSYINLTNWTVSSCCLPSVFRKHEKTRSSVNRPLGAPIPRDVAEQTEAKSDARDDLITA